MGEMKHTPGIWIAKPDPTPFLEDDYIIGVEGGDPDAVATCSRKDAPIIRAAPDMLDALIDAERLFLHTWAMDGTVHKKMKAAIASATTALSKAEGRSLSSASGQEGGE